MGMERFMGKGLEERLEGFPLHRPFSDNFAVFRLTGRAARLASSRSVLRLVGRRPRLSSSTLLDFRRCRRLPRLASSELVDLRLSGRWPRLASSTLLVFRLPGRLSLSEFGPIARNEGFTRLKNPLLICNSRLWYRRTDQRVHHQLLLLRDQLALHLSSQARPQSELCCTEHFCMV